MLASIVAIRERQKNPTTSVTVVRMIEEDCAGSSEHVAVPED
jgi:hypothetical protein